WPCETRTSTCRSFATISSGLYRFLAIAVLLDVKDIPQVGPLQWGWITVAELVAGIDGNRQHSNLSSAIRLFVLGVYRDQHRQDRTSAAQTSEASGGIYQHGETVPPL